MAKVCAMLAGQLEGFCCMVCVVACSQISSRFLDVFHPAYWQINLKTSCSFVSSVSHLLCLHLFFPFLKHAAALLSCPQPPENLTHHLSFLAPPL
jgi:hypothetical protein